jgi:hypothetical protein
MVKKLMVLLACVALAFSLKWIVYARNASASVTCPNLLQAIYGAKEQWSIDHHKTTNDTPTWDDLVGPGKYLHEKPRCPKGGGAAFSNSIVTSTAAQTWPIRGTLFNLWNVTSTHGLPNINLLGVQNDLLQLSAYVSDPSSRNFYAMAHGSPDGYWFFQERNAPRPAQRYRFAFLDGCSSYSWHNFSYFGATLEEVGEVQRPFGGDPGWYDVTWYEYSGLRPAAWVGNITGYAGGFALNPPQADPKTGFMCSWTLTPANGNWNTQFLFYWIVEGLGLEAARFKADALAWGPSADPATPPLSKLAVQWDSDGNPTAYWEPNTSRAITGFLNLRFNDYNFGADTW